MKRSVISNLLGLIGAAIGGVLGFYTFGWLIGYGFHGEAIPGALLGLGCGLLAQHRSLARGIVCGVAALALSVFTEWYYLPFVADRSLSYMATHLQDLPAPTLVLMAIGTIVAFWAGRDAGFRLLPWSRSPRPVEMKASDRVDQS
jgi:hypothetical protein